MYGVQETSDGGYIIGGYSDSNISGDKTENSNGVDDYWVVKLAAGSPRLDNPVDLSLNQDAYFLDAFISPNPTSGVFSIVIHEPLQQGSIITVLNALGETVYSQESTADAVESKQTISLGNEIPAGMYFLKIVSGDKMITRQIVVKH